MLGDSLNSVQLLYSYVFSAAFEPETTVLVMSESIPEQLNRFDVVIITETPTPDESNRLRSYVQNGGILEPNILEGETTIDNPALAEFLSSEPHELIEADILQFTPTKIVIQTRQSGFIVLSEKFYKFKEWQASVNNKPLKKFNANIISTAVYVNEGDTLTFEYKPTSFYIGFFITLLSIAAAVVLLILAQKRASKNKEHLLPSHGS